MTLSSALETVAVNHDVLIKFGGGPSQFFPALCNGSDIFMTAAITFQNETNKWDVDLCASGERVDGIVVGEAFPTKVDLTKDSDDCFSDNTYIRCYAPIAQDQLWATVTTATSISKDGWAKYVGGFLTSATNKNDAVCKLDNGGTAITGASSTEQIASVKWGTD